MKKAYLKEIIKEEIRRVLNEKMDFDVEQAIRKNILPKADQDYLDWTAKSNFPKEEVPWKWDLQPGSKFIKLIKHEKGGGQYIWGFVAQVDGEHKKMPFKKGDVFKAAGFGAPAKHKRGSAFDKNAKWKWTGPDYLR